MLDDMVPQDENINLLNPVKIDSQMNSDDLELVNRKTEVSLSEAQKKFVERRKKFDKQFEQTLASLVTNMDFLTTQQRNVDQLVKKAKT
jgi:hypothetical protein